MNFYVAMRENRVEDVKLYLEAISTEKAKMWAKNVHTIPKICSTEMCMLMQSYGLTFDYSVVDKIMQSIDNQNNVKFCAYLLDQGMSVDMLIWDRTTLIFSANIEVCKLLYARGCRMDIINYYGSTLLLRAAAGILYNNENTEVLYWLLSLNRKDLNVFHRDQDGVRALDYIDHLPKVRKLILGRMVAENILVLRSTLNCPRLSRSRRQLARLTSDLFREVSKMLV